MNPFIKFEKNLLYYLEKNDIKLLYNNWNENSRVYHNLIHLEDIIKEIEKSNSFKFLDIYEKSALLLAAFFHDAIYDPTKTNNEDESVKLFKKLFKINDSKMIKTVCDLIETTKYRKIPIKKLEKIFWNADNAGFKRGYKELLNNENFLRKEYSFLSNKVYKEKRIKFLESNIGLFNLAVDKDLKKLIEHIKQKY